MSVQTLRIEGMTCQHCVKTVTNALKAVAGVRSVSVSLEEKKASLVVDDASFSEKQAEAAIAEEGYTVISPPVK